MRCLAPDSEGFFAPPCCEKARNPSIKYFPVCPFKTPYVAECHVHSKNAPSAEIERVVVECVKFGDARLYTRQVMAD